MASRLAVQIVRNQELDWDVILDRARQWRMERMAL